MALIKCSECGREISDKAPACPGCGNPLQTQNNQKPVVIEQTSKSWKGLQLISGILIIFSLFVVLGNVGNQDPTNVKITGMGTLLLFLGIIGLIIGKIGAWWNHR